MEFLTSRSHAKCWESKPCYTSCNLLVHGILRVNPTSYILKVYLRVRPRENRPQQHVPTRKKGCCSFPRYFIQIKHPRKQEPNFKNCKIPVDHPKWSSLFTPDCYVATSLGHSKKNHRKIRSLGSEPGWCFRCKIQTHPGKSLPMLSLYWKDKLPQLVSAITMVSKSLSKDRVVGPLPNGRSLHGCSKWWLVGGWKTHLFEKYAQVRQNGWTVFPKFRDENAKN